MKSMLRMISAFLLAAQTLGNGSLRALAPTKEDDRTRAVEVEKIVRERLQAAVRGDRTTWRRHVSKDCIWTGPGLANGTTADAELEIGANSSLPALTMEIRDFEVHVFDAVAVATYVSIDKPARGNGAGKRFRKTDTYLRRGGDWQLICAAEVFAPPRPVAQIDPSVYDLYAGQFALDPSHVVRVWREGNRLLSQQAGEEKPTEFLPAGADTFFVDGDLGEWIFGRAEDGRVDRLIFRLNGSDIELRRVNP
jgi:hypothetical protein